MGTLQHIEHQISALNDLIRINNDRITGYKKQSDATEETDLLDIFAILIAQSQQNVNELIDYIHILGGKPTDGTTLSGKFYHAWINVKSVFAKADRQGLLEYCENSEDMAKSAYRKALDDKELIWEDDKVTALLNKQFEEFKRSHQQVKELRDLDSVSK
jgi:uncharacterized protein (TIGR02284 family)